MLHILMMLLGIVALQVIGWGFLAFMVMRSERLLERERAEHELWKVMQE